MPVVFPYIFVTVSASCHISKSSNFSTFIGFGHSVAQCAHGVTQCFFLFLCETFRQAQGTALCILCDTLWNKGQSVARLCIERCCFYWLGCKRILRISWYSFKDCFVVPPRNDEFSFFSLSQGGRRLMKRSAYALPWRRLLLQSSKNEAFIAMTEEGASSRGTPKCRGDEAICS
jgi:hypothetical protein